MMEKMLNKFIDNLKETFKERLSSAFLYGSYAVDETLKKDSDINIIVIIKDLHAHDLKIAHKFSTVFTKIKNSMPVFMDEGEWFNSCDVYAIEYSDIKNRNKILYGKDLISDLKVDKKDLRLQCEREVKNLLVRLRQTYLAKSSDKNAMKNLIKTSSKTFIAMFRAILTLLGQAPPASQKDVIEAFADKIKTCETYEICKGDFDLDMFLKILTFRETSKGIKDNELDSVVQKLIDTTDSVLKYVDKI